jgi:multidrug efflux system outer membrane protein
MKIFSVCGVVTAATILLAGCTVGPNYKRPQIPVPDQYRGAPAADESPVSLADTKWQDLFPDPTLHQLVNSALQHNFDLHIAAERIEEARAQLGVVRANQYPFLDVQTTLTASRSSSIGANTFVPANSRLQSTYTGLGAALSWEADIFGRLRRLTEAARADFLASGENRRAVQVSLVSTVMNTWFQLLEQDSELQISRNTETIAQNSLKLVQLRHERGAASGLDVSQAEELLYTATARKAAAELAMAQTENLLSLLQGSAPAAQPRNKRLEDIPMPAQVPPGLPAALLERRPDIRLAEQNLVAANAQIGAAKALYYPQFSLTAFAGGQSRYLTDILTAPGRVYTAAPSALQAIFHGGQIRNQVRFSEAQQRELVVAYQKSIYTALREVADGLSAFDRLREERLQQEHLVGSLENRVRLSELRYQGGLDSYLQVFDAQRNLFSGQLALAQLRLAERESVVEVYRSLGGGWSTP